MPPGFVLRTFGPLEFERGDWRLTRFPTRKSGLILARIALARDGRMERDALAELLWPDDYLDITRGRLRQELRRLRQVIGEFDSHLQSDRYQVGIEPGVLTTDALMFDALVAEGSDETPSERVARLSSAVDLLRGPFLAGYQEPWVFSTRRQYDEKARRALLALADAWEALGEQESALNAIIQAVHHDPLDTGANGRLIRRLVALGQGNRARQAFLQFDGMLFRELGHHAPDSIRALLAGTKEAPLPPTQEPRTVVPRPAELFGREERLAFIDAALAEPGACVLLVGALGVGKTHLLRACAWRFSLANQLPVQLGGEPSPVADGLFVLESTHEPREIERTIAAAARNGWRVLAESRVRLDMAGVSEVRVNPLPTGPNEDEAAVRLLASQTSSEIGNESIRASLAALATCLSGLPLALKLFAKRLEIQSPEQAIQDLDSGLAAFAELETSTGESVARSLIGTLEQMPPLAKEAFDSLCLLDGACPELASKLASFEILRLLENHSLICVQGEGSRRRMQVPRPLAFVARQRLAASDRDQVAERTWQIMADWTYDTSRYQTGPYQVEAFDRVAVEWPNIMSGVRWGIDYNAAVAAHLVAGAWRTVGTRGMPPSNVDLFLEAVQLGAASLPCWPGGEAWLGTGIALALGGRIKRAEPAFLAAIETFEKGNHLVGQSWATLNYAALILARTDPPRAVEVLKKLATTTPRTEHRHLALSDCASILVSLGNLDEAVRIAEEAFEIRTQAVDPSNQGRAYGELAHIYIAAGRPEAARPLLIEGIRRLRELGIQFLLTGPLLDLARISLDSEESRALLDEAAEIARRLGSPQYMLDVARVRLEWEQRRNDIPALLAAIEAMFRFTQLLDSSEEREASLRSLAGECLRRGKEPYANAVIGALGDPITGPVHEGWRSLLSSDSNRTVCTLAVALAQEAFG
ncbi:AfsR/SARP family transcriptional regulator [Fimbriimonas ginsengisoli]|uniref:Transcriptional activator n=1 Tax=Fimbriimonas ginsengisoli Gsoil 348 TaxID=661478 RepID=A0A068NV93_FIMGI|nr:BTAD domain-containing putative transcriptional regulator [Fimbriimonas ginsengisoli]AIE85494.1 transcriptional activator [Fimbriimonas ginsengisoli Gsoil 348]